MFTGLEVPSDTYRLVVKMSPAQSPGTSSGWSKTVIVAPGIAYNQEFTPRARVTLNKVAESEGFESLDFELSHGSTILSVDALYSYNTSIENSDDVVTLGGFPADVDVELSYLQCIRFRLAGVECHKTTSSSEYLSETNQQSNKPCQRCPT